MKDASWAWWPTERGLRYLQGLLAVVGLALLAKLGQVLWSADTAPSAPRLFVDRIVRCLETAQPVEHRRRGLDRLLAHPVSEAPGCPRGVALPAVLEADGSGPPSSVTPLARAGYRLDYAVPADWPPGTALLLYAPRTNGLAWRVWADGQALADNLDDWRMTWIRPVAATVPAALLRPGQPLRIDLAVAYDPRAGHALAPLLVGPVGAVAGALRWREAIQFTLPQACSVVLLVLGSFFLGVWAARRRDTAPLLLGLASVPWAVCNLQYVLPRADDPTLERWYNGIVIVSVVWFMALVYLFALRIAPQRLHRVEWPLGLYVLAMSVLALPNLGLLDDEGLAFLLVNDAVAAAVTVLICRLAVCGGNTELRVVAVTLLLALAAGTHDIALLAGWVPPQHIYVLPYAGVLVFCGFLFAVQRRYVQALRAHEALSESLAQRLAEREANLLENHHRLRELERAQTLAAERQRLMRDMHDGLGAVLTASLVAVERGELRSEAVAPLLRDCVDELRIVIDSLAPGEQDLVALLAMLRMRMQRRLEAAGLRLEWDIGELPPMPWLGPSETVHVLRIVQEALANVIKHARACTVRVSLRQVGDAAELCCADDGSGFDPHVATPGRGLRSMAQRCEILGGTLEMHSRPGAGSALRLRLPLEK